ncbi:uncharacterized protein [Palaemon carinicauda]
MKRATIFNFFVLLVQFIPDSNQNETTTTIPVNTDLTTENSGGSSPNAPVTIHQSSQTSSSEPTQRTTWAPTTIPGTQGSEYGCEYKKTWYHHAQPIYKDECIGYVCLNGTWFKTNHSDPKCCSNIYYKLHYGTVTTSAQSSLTDNFWATSTELDIPARRGIYWEYMYDYYKFPWWYDSINGTTSWDTEYYNNKNELENQDLPLNGIAYTGSCEQLVCIGRENINRTGVIHPKCCFYDGDWYQHGYPMYKKDCSAQVCSGGSWVKINFSDPYCCSDIYHKVHYETAATSAEGMSTENFWTTSMATDPFSSIFSTGGLPMTRRKRGIYWEYLYYYQKFPWWDDSINGTTSWYTEYYNNKNELENHNLPLNGIAYTGSCEQLVCIGRENINRTGVTHPKCCSYNGDWYHHGYPMYNNNCTAQVCSDGDWLQLDHSDPYCCSNIYYKLQYDSVTTSAQSSSTDNLWATSSESDILSSTFPSVGTTMSRRKRGIYWEYIYDFYRFPWWYDSINGTTSWYTEYYNNNNELESSNLPLNGIAYTGSCEQLFCIGRENINRTGVIHPKCCSYNGDWYHHGYPMYNNNCTAQVCSDGDWLQLDHSDPYCCSNIYYKLQYETVTTSAQSSSTDNLWTTSTESDILSSTFPTVGTTMSRRKRGIYWEYIYYYYRFPWWDDSINGTASWDTEYYNNKNELESSNLPLNGIAYTGSCEQLVCIGRENINRTGVIHPKCCSYNGDWYHHGYPMYNNNCTAQVCSDGDWLQLDHSDPYCCVNPDVDSVFPDYNYNYFEYYYYGYNQNTRPKGWYKLNETRVLADCQEVTCASRDNWVPTNKVIPNCNIPQGCNFDDIYYNHTARLPGCFQVFCSRGVWVHIGHIDRNCSECKAYWDPHLITFDGHSYDYHGTCEYTLAQDGTTTDPQYAVNSEFMECWGAACVGPSTFKDSPMTVIKMGAYGRYSPQLYKILVNGIPYEIPDRTPTLVKEGTMEHPVLAWRHRYGCIRLLGSSSIAVEKCGSSLSVWASPNFHEKLYGLCGYFDGDSSNDFFKRDGTTSTLTRFPTGEEFPDSWETTCAIGGLHGAAPDSSLRRIKRNEPMNCTIEEDVEVKLRSKCNQTIDTSEGLSQEMINILIDNCVYDTCSIYQNTSGNATAIEEWIGQVQATVEDISDIVNKTSDTDVLPEILFQDPFEVTTVKTLSPESPLDTNNYSKRKNLLLRLIMKVNVGKLCHK